jgi:hypothetical protein
MGDALKTKVYGAVLDLVEQDLRANQSHSESMTCCPLNAVDEMSDGIAVRVDVSFSCTIFALTRKRG